MVVVLVVVALAETSEGVAVLAVTDVVGLDRERTAGTRNTSTSRRWRTTRQSADKVAVGDDDEQATGMATITVARRLQTTVPSRTHM